MFYTILDDLILYQKLTIKPSKYSNYELILHRYFHEKTKGIDPSYIFLFNIESIDFIFFFVKQNDYFQAKTYLNSIRNKISSKKVLIIRVDNILINLLFNLFPDLSIHDIHIELNNKRGKYEISICFLKELNIYHIAVGERGCYIKAVNEFFDKHINFQNCKVPLTIKCRATG
ncbi:MAG: hypothetical protein JSV62_06930 [Promethearchaeota archaeon]|nr:MAG: hypothetical protein JSV62_06930 [Candidatus Lokiarchaeota archaeon]